MKVIKYIFWLVIIGLVGATYHYVLDESLDANKSVKFKKIRAGKYLTFFNIDNKAKVYVNDSLIYDSGIIDYNPNLNLDVDLEPHLKEGQNLVKIELLNGDCLTCEPSPWVIRYELVQNEEETEYVFDSSGGIGDLGGLRFEKTHEVYYNSK